MASRAACTKLARSSTTLTALTVIVMTGVNGTSKIVVLVCWPLFKAEKEKERDREIAIHLCLTGVLVNRAWIWYTSEGGCGG